MKKGEKFLSFVKYEKELESEYREKLSSVKRPEEVGVIFMEFAIRLLKKIVPDLDEKECIEDVSFVPEDEEVGFILSERLKKFLKEEIIEKSDLMAILRRMASEAIHRYKKIKADEERTELFRRRPDVTGR